MHYKTYLAEFKAKAKIAGTPDLTPLTEAEHKVYAKYKKLAYRAARTVAEIKARDKAHLAFNAMMRARK